MIFSPDSPAIGTDSLSANERCRIKQCLVPTPNRGDTVIMDNLPVHKVAGVAEAIDAAGATLIYLPKYSPDLKPIELAFSNLKAHLRKAAEHTIPRLLRRIGRVVTDFRFRSGVSCMRRRDFIIFLGSTTAAWPLAAKAQQQASSVVGWLAGANQAANEPGMPAFRAALSAHGFVEGRNLTLDFRYADGQPDRIPALAADLLRRHVDARIDSTPPRAV
jgi:hypothetical protein